MQRCSSAAVQRWIGDLVTQVTRGTAFVWCSVGVLEPMQGAQWCNLPRWGLATV